MYIYVVLIVIFLVYRYFKGKQDIFNGLGKKYPELTQLDTIKYKTQLLFLV